MSTTNTLSILTDKLNPIGQQRLFEFLDVVDTDTAARFRSWLGTASDTEVTAAAELLNRASHGRMFAEWWQRHDRALALQPTQSVFHAHSRTPLQRGHSQAHARNANKDLTVGGAWLLAGLLVTFGSYSMAVNSPGGGHYVIATGAMIYGVMRLLRGLKAG